MVGRIVRWFSRPRAPVVAAITGLVGRPDADPCHGARRREFVVGLAQDGGRYDDSGTLIRSQVDLLFVLRNVVMPRSSSERASRSTLGRLGVGAATGRTRANRSRGRAAAAGGACAAAQPSGRPGQRHGRRRAAADRRVVPRPRLRRRVGRRSARGSGADRRVLAQRERAEPVGVAVFGGTEPRRSIGSTPDPWQTWEWRTHLGQPAAAPSGEPGTLDQLRIAYNVAMAAGDARRRSGGASGSRVGSTTRPGWPSRGVRLLGVRVTGGVQPLVENWFQCSAQMGDAIVQRALDRGGARALQPDRPGPHGSRDGIRADASDQALAARLSLRHARRARPSHRE